MAVLINVIKEKYRECIRVLTKLGRVLRECLFEEVTFKLRPEGISKRQVKMGERRVFQVKGTTCVKTPNWEVA